MQILVLFLRKRWSCKMQPSFELPGLKRCPPGRHARKRSNWLKIFAGTPLLLKLLVEVLSPRFWNFQLRQTKTAASPPFCSQHLGTKVAWARLAMAAICKCRYKFRLSMFRPPTERRPEQAKTKLRPSHRTPRDRPAKIAWRMPFRRRKPFLAPWAPETSPRICGNPPP